MKRLPAVLLCAFWEGSAQGWSLSAVSSFAGSLLCSKTSWHEGPPKLFGKLCCWVNLSVSSMAKKSGAGPRCQEQGVNESMLVVLQKVYASSEHCLHSTTLYWTQWPFLLSFILKSYFIWRIVNLQCCVSFRCKPKWFGYTYTNSNSFSDSLPI